MAISSLTLGITSFLLWILTGLPAVVTGILALRKINRSNGQLTGSGLAIAGIITGCVSTILAGPILVALLLPAVQAARHAAQRNVSMNNMKQIILGEMNFADAHRSTYPAPGGGDRPEGGAQLSWRVHLLPYIEHAQLYEQFHLDEPWDSPHNRTLIEKMPDVYRDPTADVPAGQTTYLLVTGPGTAFDDPTAGPRNRDFPDGLSNTIVLVQADATEAVEWTKPKDWTFDPANPTRGLGATYQYVFMAAMADGHVRSIRNDTPPETIQALMTRAGREAITLP